MIDPSDSIVRAALENRLRELRDLRISLEAHQRHLPMAANESGWAGPARAQFDDNIRQLSALWSEALDELSRAERATRNAIDHGEPRGE